MSIVLGLSLLSIVSSELPAFSQEINQEEITRKPKVKVVPKYPDLARQLHISGKVKIEVIVSPDGRVKDARLIGGSPILANAALDAVRQWKYEAGPLETITVVVIDFKDSRK